MGNADDRQHFEDYRLQTAVKHEILAAYLGPYFTVVGKGHPTLLYVDGFAGRGTYTRADTGDVVDGSPLRALRLVAGNPTYAKKVATVFVEEDPQTCERLEASAAAFWRAHGHIAEPVTHCGRFADVLGGILARAGGRLPPTFLFVDPCGVSGTSFDVIRGVMACRSSEAFIFFNVDGVRRIAGLDRLSPVLVELLGSEARAADLFARLRAEPDVGRREQLILSGYRLALRDGMGVRFTIPFRVEAEEARKTSHYLIHASNHPLGFKIMKDVMWARGQSEDGAGALEFVQASRANYIPLFGRHREIKAEVLRELAGGTRCVDLLYKDWVCRPDNLNSQTAYKDALLEMEAAGAIEVLDKDGRTPKPVGSRRPHRGRPTLGEGYFVRATGR